LVKVADGYPIWSEKYERDEKDLFSLQDDISLDIIDKLRIELLGEVRTRVVKRYTDNKEAYDSYLKGMWLCYNKATEEEWRNAIVHFERAIEMDQYFSLAYVGLANACMRLSFYHFISADKALPKAKEALENALKIDSKLPEALAASGVIKWRFEFDWADGEADIKMALEYSPNYGLAHAYLATILLLKGQLDEAFKERLAAVELDPLSIDTQATYAWFLYQARRYEEALQQCNKTLGLDPDYPLTHVVLGLCYAQKSLFQESITALKKAVDLSGNSTENLSFLAFGYAASGNSEQASKILRELDKLAERAYVSKFLLASVQAALGDKDKAFALLEMAREERDPDLIWLKTDPKYDYLRSDQRYEELLKKIGLKN
jgi:Tfp pilus assembly protein PilF